MTQHIPRDRLQGHTQMRVAVNGPKRANTLYVITGRAPVQIDSSGEAATRQTVSFLVGPRLKNRRFHRATATACIADLRHDGEGRGRWSIEAVDADWDDESGRTEVRVEVAVWGGAASAARVRALGYQVNLLTER